MSDDLKQVGHGLRPLGRIHAINGHVIAVSGRVLDAFRVGQRIIVDDAQDGTTPRAGFATVDDVTSEWISVDSPGAMMACVGDYLFEKPPTAEELRAADIERRLADLEQRAVTIPADVRDRLAAFAEAVRAMPAPPADPAALLRAAIAQQVRRSACDPAGLLTLAQALEAVNRAAATLCGS